MIERITVENFKSLRKVDLALGNAKDRVPELTCDLEVSKVRN